jgi:hypothetical protein
MAIRPALCATAFAAALAACGSDSGGEGESGTATGSPSPAQAVASATANPDDDALRAFQADWPRTDFSQRTVSLNEVFQGCPGADCIPALDAEGDGVVSIAAPRGGHARFTTIDDVDYEAQLPVAAVEHNGEARAYPLHILTFHEIVNDVLGGDPVAVTFCPLCNTAISFRREVGGDVLDFSVSGLLRNSDLVMYDRQTESWWQQATGEGIAGTHAGTQLEFVSTRILSWGDFAARFPDGTVLTEDTGFFSGYGRNPYISYDSSSRPFLFSGEIDSRLPGLERVVALEAGDEAVAVLDSARGGRRQPRSRRRTIGGVLGAGDGIRT